MKRAQAAMEFLTTYGWAFLVILLVIGGLSYFNVFDFKRVLPDGCEINNPKLSCGDIYQIRTSANPIPGEVTIHITNEANQAITITAFRIVEKNLEFAGNWCDTEPAANEMTIDDPTAGPTWSDQITINAGQTVELTANFRPSDGIRTDAPDFCGIDALANQKGSFLFEMDFTQGNAINIQQIAKGKMTTTVSP